MRSSLLIIILFTTLLSANMPEWFQSRTYQPANAHEIVGYGMGKSLKEATLHAKEDIAGQLLTEISSTKESHLSEKHGRLSKHMDIKIDAQVHTVLSDIKTLRMEADDGTYYVVSLYENLRLSQSLINKTEEITCIQHAPNPYLALTPLYEDVKKAAGCDIDFSLERKDSVWYIAYAQTLLPIAPVDYEDLFISSKQSPVTLKASSRTLREGDEFYFTLLSSQSGYVTLMNIYENGMTAVVGPSMKIEKDRYTRIPGEDADEYFEAGLLHKGRATHDLYVAFFTTEPIDLSRFEMSSDQLVEGETAYKADELIRMTQKYPFTTLFIRTKVRKE